RTFTVKQGVRDIIKPQVTIVSPAAGARVTNAFVTVRGTAKDESGVARVECWVDNGPSLMATGTVSWGAQLELSPGTNRVFVKSIDLGSNESVPVMRSVFFAVLRPLSLSTNGVGSVTPFPNGKLLEIGKSYMLTATPGKGYVFSNWSGTVMSSTSRLS